MSSEPAELDLYADDIGDEFSQENEFNDNDLYDDVITSNSKSRNTDDHASGQTNGQSSGSSGLRGDRGDHTGGSSHSSNNNSQSDSSERLNNRKPSVYVGNLTWWTTDSDVIKAMGTIGINDVLEVKFFENRANGQSKGFCMVQLQSDASVRIAIEKMSKCVIHGLNPAVTMCSRQNLNNFEMKSRKPGQNGQNNDQNNRNNRDGGNFMNNNRNNFQNQGGMGGGQRAPLIQRPLRPNAPLLTAQPRLALTAGPLGAFGTNAQQWSQLAAMQNGPRNNALQGSAAPALNPLLRMPQGNRQLGSAPLLSAPSQDLRSQLSSVSGLNHNALNAAQLFGAQGFGLSQSGGDFPNRLAAAGLSGPYGGPGGHPSAADFSRSLDMGISEAEMEEIINKNRTLSNNAIARALSDASSGEFSAAIDTLHMAISLITQSRVAHDDRTKVVVASLQDTLQSIEARASMGGGSSSRDRSSRSDRSGRSRSRDRERGSSRREKSSRRERSRSRERDYRERSRDRHYEDRHYEDRYREKDREREHRSSRH